MTEKINNEGEFTPHPAQESSPAGANYPNEVESPQGTAQFSVQQISIQQTIAEKKTGVSTAGLVLGILAVVFSVIPLVNVIMWPMAILAIIFGGIGIVKKQGGKAIAALVLGIVSLIIFYSMYVAAATVVKNALDESTSSSTSAQNSSKPAEDAHVPIMDDNIFIESFNPDIAETGKLIFEVPTEVADSQDCQMQIQTGFWGTQTGSVDLK